jgi:DNA-binding winged helix-turn-helix (wHTH) protein
MQHILLVKRRGAGDRALFARLEQANICVSWEEASAAAKRRLAVQRFTAVAIAPDIAAKSLDDVLRGMMRSLPSIALREPPDLRDRKRLTRREAEQRAHAFADQIAHALNTRSAPREPVAGRQFAFGPYALNDGTREVSRRNGPSVPLTTAEFELLSALVRMPKSILSRDDLARRTGVQAGGATERSVDVLICRLRRKIEPDPRDPTYIKTVRDRGYLFAAPVHVSA